ncbi:DinB family protein [Ulvibacterium marinum]|uniref:DinB family protein n=1 Tax=Ulvibacterium marinum TaxID=2419782 RepID=UPI002494742E|nr:DinB family protein [Ulvibacterium marinum]
MEKTLILLLAIVSISLNAQNTMNDSVPYATIPKAPKIVTPGTVVSRMIDGLGFRYYWATEGLTTNELDHQPDNGGRTIAETIDHVYNLSLTILRSAQKRPRDFSEKQPLMNNDEKRKKTLEYLAEASVLFKTTEDLIEHKVIFVRSKGTSEFPIWNQINGPIEDAVWHAGQIATLRRLAGNPMNPKVNVFLGKLND